MSLCCEEKANKMPDEKKTQTVTVISFVTRSFFLWFDHLVVEVHGNWIYTRLRVVSYFVDSGEIRVRACVKIASSEERCREDEPRVALL